MVAAIMIGAIGGGDAGMAAVSGVQAATQANQLRYSRGREQEADRVGLNTVVRAGLDPQGMVRMFERMHRAYRFTSKPPEFLLTHPLSETRIADARSQVLQYGTKRYPRSLDYQMMRNRTRLHFADSPESMVKVFERELREQPDDLATQYGLALALSAAEEHVEAIAMLDRILVSNPRNILYSASLAEVLIKAGKAEQAIALVERELAINPDNAPLGHAARRSADRQRPPSRSRSGARAPERRPPGRCGRLVQPSRSLRVGGQHHRRAFSPSPVLLSARRLSTGAAAS